MGSETRFLAATVTVSGVAAWLLVADPPVTHSPVSDGVLVAACVGGLFAVSQVATDDRGVLWGYVALVVALVALGLELTGTVAVGSLAGALVLFLLALALFDLADRYGVPRPFVPRVWVKRLFLVVVVLAVVVATVDAASGAPSYELRTDGEVRVNQRGMQAPLAFLGEIVVTNPGPFPQDVELPAYEACAAGNWSTYRPEAGDGERRPVAVYLQADGYYGEYVSGWAQHRYGAILLFDATDIDGELFPVRRTERCPAGERGEPYLAVYDASESE
jgi:hypothetical protein